MNAENYLVQYGWTQGEALRFGGLKKPILVKHKKDQKGLGHTSDQHEAWWERVFDGQLKSLNVVANKSGTSFEQSEVKVSGISQNLSPLYRSFIRGEGLKGTIGNSEDGAVVKESSIMMFDSSDDEEDSAEKKAKKERKRAKKEKISKKEDKVTKRQEKKAKKQEKKSNREEKKARAEKRKRKRDD
ncbi:hypothetical protein NADFUDRAFT_82946 [Nadsonia fulvescens var. elongata DSM 6958]|uniref:G-patch domain-containing protein n=1 Tax=Nadsonia fulvescens var. elongata DSM 6958 TaxID=857566 RepID=A0A1E3PKW2_9ASCO|nr:hypothetical protein NADFUDRAFT_82946 [Nadsonia fulvescens var. elongata DSM 6958]